ncbi:MAG: hypothetical protein JOY67_12565 [Hyphomicrobiales bacterium]|nr:hypothetical protein [Hyphomicrobiales bacterium]MBV9113645.1 hypothetical protein [Hyphomicrobiales bacterium]MBV9519492.1 hypothetical protein [Hyphomicrobiales bacterium]
MDKTIVGLIGAISALATADGAQAATAPTANEVMSARSFGELLEPIPNAVALLQAADEAKAKSAREAENGTEKVAQFFYPYPYYRHHHHHHHHHHWGWGPPRPLYYHHHHHHHHHHHYGPIFHSDR